MSDTNIKSKNERKLRTYRKFKITHGKELYLSVVYSHKARQQLTNFLISCHNLSIETRCHRNIELERVCVRCHTNAIEDKEHFLLNCPLYDAQRHKLVNTMRIEYPNFDILPSRDKFVSILRSQNRKIILAVAEYINKAMEKRDSHSLE